MRILVGIGAALALFWGAQPSQAAVRLPRIFSDGMVLQRELPVTVWGWAQAGEAVSVKIAGQVKSANADAAGKWQIALDPLSPGAPRTLTVSGRDNVVEVNDVLVGEVFLCSGQSNMAMSMSACLRRPGTKEDIAATLPAVRFFSVPTGVFAAAPQEDVQGEWASMVPHKNASFSAVAFYFARALHERLKLPIGIVRASHAGGSIETKMSIAALQSTGAGKKSHTNMMARYTPEALAARDKIFLERWQKAVKEAEALGMTPPPQPKAAPAVDGGYPAADWNQSIAPIIRFTKRAVLWYQGEHNAGNAFAYRELLPSLIKDWRAASGQERLPFLIVQLPAYGHPEAEKNWPLLRESQWFAQRATPHTALVVTIDRGEKNDIHPADKREVGERLALEARRLLYGEAVTGCGPLFEGFAVHDGSIVVRFKGGALTSSGGARLSGFFIAGEDRKFVAAQAEIRGATVVVSSPAVPNPVAVRYAWAGFPEVALFDANGLPAAPFRTDDW